jgi:Xaa-Pro aminopeptidase
MPASLAARTRALRQRLARRRADALLVTNPRDIRYLTGFVGDDSWALIETRRFEEQIAHEAPHARTRIRKDSLAAELAALVKTVRLRHLALQPDHVSLTLRKTLAKELPSLRLSAHDDGLIQQRAAKDEGEVAAIRQALSIQQQAFRRTCAATRPGQTETQIAARLEFEMRSLGADGTSFPSIVAVDGNASLPHAIPGPCKAHPGALILIDWGARWQGYCGDLTRVVALGRMLPKMREVYRIVLDAQLAAIDAIAPGKTLKEVDAIARGIIRKAGYAKRFGHGLGHGLGLDIHEQPVLSFRSTGVLEPGQVVTVEPGIYLPGIGGVRIEDDVLVTAKGHEVLSDLPKDLASAII